MGVPINLTFSCSAVMRMFFITKLRICYLYGALSDERLVFFFIPPLVLCKALLP